MKNIIKKINNSINRVVKRAALILLCSVVLTQCSDFLDPSVDNARTADEMFSSAYYFAGPLNDAYSALASQFNLAMDNLTDNSVARDMSSDYFISGNGGMRPDNFPMGNWVSAYRQIRRINMFLERMVLNPDPDAVLPTPVRFYPLRPDTYQADIDDNIALFWRMYGEAHFLRAYYLSELLRNYGGVTADGQVLGVPLVYDEVIEVTEDLTLLDRPRATYAATVQAIVDDLNVAIDHLPVRWLGTHRVTGVASQGRANGIAAMALKARVLLYAASPMFNVNDDPELWEAAAIAAADAIASLDAAHRPLINSPDPNAANDIADNYYFLQLQTPGTNQDNSRDLFFRANIQTGNRGLEADNYPPSMFGNALINPTQNYVDAFPDRNGYPIFPTGSLTVTSSIYDPANPYANRDPRLRQWVAFSGSQMGPGGYHTIETFEGGIDAFNPLRNTSRTGYYLRKLLRAKNVSWVPGVTGQATPRAHIILGKPELYLTFAEAANKAWGGPTGDPHAYGFNATQILTEVIRRYYHADVEAGAWNAATHYITTEIGDDPEKFNDYVKIFRRLELSFEGHYFYDKRRWIGDGSTDALNVDIYGTKIFKEGTPENPEFTYQRVLLETRNFRSPYMPIPYAELYNAPAILPNKGWE